MEPTPCDHYSFLNAFVSPASADDMDAIAAGISSASNIMAHINSALGTKQLMSGMGRVLSKQQVCGGISPVAGATLTEASTLLFTFVLKDLAYRSECLFLALFLLHSL